MSHNVNGLRGLKNTKKKKQKQIHYAHIQSNPLTMQATKFRLIRELVNNIVKCNTLYKLKKKKNRQRQQL